MSYSSTSASRDFLFARLHGMFANGVHGESMEQIMQSPTMEALQFNLHPFAIDISRREAMHESVTTREYDRLGSVCRSLGGSSAQYYRAFMSRLYFQNLAALLNLRYFPQDEEERLYSFAQHRLIPKIDAESLLEIRGDDEFVAALPLYDGVSREQISALVRRILKHRNVLKTDADVDRIFYSCLLAAAKGAARLLVAEEIDIENLSILMRNAVTYHLSDDLLDELNLDGGRVLSKRHVAALVKCRSMEELASALPEPYRHLLLPLHSSDLYFSENVLWNHLNGECMRLFRDSDNPENSIAAFPYLNHFEAMNIERIYESVYFGLPIREVGDMLIS